MSDSQKPDVSPHNIDELYSIVIPKGGERTDFYELSGERKIEELSSLLDFGILQKELIAEYETSREINFEQTPKTSTIKEQITKTKNFVKEQINKAIKDLMKYKEASGEWSKLHPVWADLNIYKYLVKGSITTRVGKTITRPEITKPSDLKENYTQLTLDLARIYYEWTFDWQGDDPDIYLPYVAKPDVNDEKKNVHKKRGQELGDLADGIGAATGTAIASVFKGILGDRAEIAEIVAPYFVGLYFRKFMEIKVFHELQKDETTKIDLGKKPEYKAFFETF